MNFFKPVALFSLLVLAGCEVGPSGAIDPIAESGKSVGVFSLVPDRLVGNFVGTTIFQNKWSEVNVSSWNLDGFIEQSISNRLRSQGVQRVEVVELRPRIEMGQSDYNLLGVFNKDALAPIFEAARSEGHELVAIAQDIVWDGEATGRASSFEIQREQAFGIEVVGPELFIGFRVTFYDVGTESEISSFSVRTVQPLPQTYAKDTVSDYTVAELNALRDIVRQSIVDALGS